MAQEVVMYLVFKGQQTPGISAEVMKWIAAPMIGGMVSSTILTLSVIPVLDALCRSRSIPAVDRQLNVIPHHIGQSKQS
jgi:Cu(I)/Ag(I) efflux system membrane protein CusA/SilA